LIASPHHYINGNLHDLPIDGADFNVGYKHRHYYSNWDGYGHEIRRLQKLRDDYGDDGWR
jgi:hypothetical protein